MAIRTELNLRLPNSPGALAAVTATVAYKPPSSGSGGGVCD